MITLKRAQDLEIVRLIITDPAVYRHMVSDGSPDLESFRPVEHEKVWYMIAFDDAELLGLFMLVWLSPILLDLHVCLLPNARGRALQAYRRGLEWLWANTKCLKVTGNTPADNRLALRVAKLAGLEVIGVNEDSLMRNGKLIDQVILGMKRPK
jgi:RimJ/RimL family protein N-acetyltransferase